MEKYKLVLALIYSFYFEDGPLFSFYPFVGFSQPPHAHALLLAEVVAQDRDGFTHPACHGCLMHLDQVGNDFIVQKVALCIHFEIDSPLDDIIHAQGLGLAASKVQTSILAQLGVACYILPIH